MRVPIPKDRLDLALQNDGTLKRLRRSADRLKAQGADKRKLNQEKREVVRKAREKLSRCMIEGKLNVFRQPGQLFASIKRREEKFRLIAKEWGRLGLTMRSLTTNGIRSGATNLERLCRVYYHIGYHTARVEHALRGQIVAENRKQMHAERRARAHGLPV